MAIGTYPRKYRIIGATFQRVIVEDDTLFKGKLVYLLRFNTEWCDKELTFMSPAVKPGLDGNNYSKHNKSASPVLNCNTVTTVTPMPQELLLSFPRCVFIQNMLNKAKMTSNTLLFSKNRLTLQHN